jgi:REP-associated tyrosine transposase
MRLRELVREVCKAKDVEILKGHISRDNVHIFVSTPPHISVRDLLNAVKGRTLRWMLMDFKTLSRKFWGQRFWTQACSAANSGNMTDEVVMKYVEQHDNELPDGDFKKDGDS